MGGAFRVRQHGVHHLAHRLRGEVDVVIGAARGARPGVQEPQVVVHLGHGPDGRARIMRGRLLLDGNGRGQPLDGVHVRLFHHRQELAGIGGERLHIAPLALGIDGVEGQGGLAGPGKAGEHDQAVPRQIEIDVLQIVCPGTPDSDILHATDYYTPGVKRRGWVGATALRMARSAARPRISRSARGARGSYGGSPPVYNMCHPKWRKCHGSRRQ